MVMKVEKKVFWSQSSSVFDSHQSTSEEKENATHPTLWIKIQEHWFKSTGGTAVYQNINHIQDVYSLHPLI